MGDFYDNNFYATSSFDFILIDIACQTKIFNVALNNVHRNVSLNT